EQFVLRHLGDALTEDVNSPTVWTHEASGELQDERFAGAGLAQEHQRLPCLGGKGNAAKDFSLRKADAHIAELNDRFRGGLRRKGKAAGGIRHSRNQKTLSARK